MLVNTPGLVFLQISLSIPIEPPDVKLSQTSQSTEVLTNPAATHDCPFTAIPF